MRKFGKNLIFIKWIISYLCMLIIVLFASIGIYFYSYKIISEQQKDINRKILEKVETEVNRYFVAARNAAVSIMLDEDLEKIGNKSTDLSIEDREIIYRLYRNIQNRLSSADELEHIFIWFSNGTTVLSDIGHMDKELFYSLYFRDEGIRFSELEQKITSYANSDLIFLNRNNKDGEIVCLAGKHGRGNDKSGAVIAVSISTKKLTEQLNLLKWNDKVDLIVALGNHAILSAASGNKVEWNEGMIATALNGGDFKYGNIRLHSEVLDSDNGVSYVSLTPASLAAGEAGKIQLLTSMILLVSLTIGSIAAFFFAKSHYSPLIRLMHLFGEYNHGSGARDEFDWLTIKANQFIEEYREVKDRYVKTKERLQNQFLFRIVTLPYNRMKPEEFEHLLFPKKYNLIALIQMTESEGQEFDWNMDSNLCRFILNNIIEELMGEKYKIMVADLTECFCIIINSDSKDAKLRDEIEEAFDSALKFMSDKFGMKIKVFFGSWHTGIEGVHTSYLRSREAFEYRDIISSTDIIWYEDIKNRYMVYHYSPESEQKIINLIQIADTDTVFEMISDIIDINYHKREIKASMKRCLISDILGTLIKAVQQAGNTEFLLNYLEEHDIQNNVKEKDVLENFRNLLQIIKENSTEFKKKNNLQFSTKVMNYVKDHFHNPDLNISITALHFGITPTYLSSLFKEQTGLSLLEYINTMRVEHAKKILESDISLNEVCERSGFRNSGALIRVFKKITGLTPGQMRDHFEK